jgi:DNA (cytosine-5)-methyltransferase 1
MKVLSLFSGVGGFDMGLENAGMQTVFQCEWDKHANTILNKHWPHVVKWEDVSTLTGKHILSKAPVIDVVAWGSPCQDLSVAGKRSGLEGERSGLFHEGIRIIKELRKETNGQYPRISIWENVVGALNSNRGADFGIIINEMAEAGAMVIEWAVLDAQYFGVPQRRRRVFVIAIFDPVLAQRCPKTLLPVAESLPGHLAKSKPARQSATSKTAKSIRTSSSDNHLTDEQSYAESSFAQFKEGDVAALKASGGVLGGGSETLIVGALTVSDLTKQVTNEIVSKNLLQVVQPFVKSSRAQTADDSETFENSYRDGARIANDGITQTLSAKMGTSGGNTPMLAFDTQFGSNANVTENIAPTLKSSQAPPSVAYPIQDGRDIEKHQNGLGVGDEHSPAYTIDQTGAQAVAYPIHPQATSSAGNSRTNKDGRGNGLGIGDDGDPSTSVVGGTPPMVGQLEEPTMAVRRLTPLECERLMGWPDDHTRYKADGTEQADTHRYKQCGNGVASPVAQWIAKHLLKLEEQQ